MSRTEIFAVLIVMVNVSSGEWRLEWTVWFLGENMQLVWSCDRLQLDECWRPTVRVSIYQEYRHDANECRRRCSVIDKAVREILDLPIVFRTAGRHFHYQRRYKENRHHASKFWRENRMKKNRKTIKQGTLQR